MGSLRGRWDWLRDLVRRAVAHPETSGVALKDAFTRIGHRPAELQAGVAWVVGIHPRQLESPDASAVRRADTERLAVVLPLMLRDERPELHRVAIRWLATPALAYQLPRPRLVAWLEDDTPIATALAPRLPNEGLALLGPDALSHLSERARLPAVREAARAWAARLG